MKVTVWTLGACLVFASLWMGGARLIGYDARIYWFQNWGNVVGVVGLLVSVIGFAVTIIVTTEAVTAARAAATAAEEARESVYNFDSITQLVTAVLLLDQITDHHRECVWERLPALYGELRQLLIALKSPVSRLTPEQAATVAGVYLMLIDIDKAVEEHVQGKRQKNPPKSAAWIEILKEQADKLNVLQNELKAAQGVKDVVSKS
jgi:hypothetical protein